jgi:hypothetical protein
MLFDRSVLPTQLEDEIWVAMPAVLVSFTMQTIVQAKEANRIRDWMGRALHTNVSIRRLVVSFAS